MTRVDEIVVLAGVDSGGATRLLKVNEDGTIAGGGGGSTTALADLTDDVDVVSTPPIEGDALVFDGSKWVPGSGVLGAIQYAALDDDVPITGANTFFDGPALTLGAGRWRITGKGTMLSNGGGSTPFISLYDGTTRYAASENTTPGSGGFTQDVAWVLDLTEETTITLQAAADGGSGWTLLQYLTGSDLTAVDATWLQAEPVSVGGAGGSVATAPLDLPATGDLTLTSSGTDYDAPGVSVELPAGTYRFEANGVILASAGNVYLYIWDGTTKYGGSAVSVTTLAGGYVPMSAYAIVTLETTTTVKLSVRSNAGGNQLISNPDSVVGIGTHMSYERIG